MSRLHSALEFLAVKLDKTQVQIPQVAATDAQVASIFGFVLSIAGAIAVVFMILGGVKYSTSQGDAASTKLAKEMIIYSVVGVVVIMMSFAIVQLVVGRVF